VKKFGKILLFSLIFSVFCIVSAFCAEDAQTFFVNIVVNGDEYAEVKIGASVDGNVYTFQVNELLGALGLNLTYDETTDIAAVSAKEGTLAEVLFSEMSGETSGDASNEHSGEIVTDASGEPSGEIVTDASGEPSGEIVTDASDEPSGEIVTGASGEPSGEPAEGAAVEPTDELSGDAAEETVVSAPAPDSEPMSDIDFMRYWKRTFSAY